MDNNNNQNTDLEKTQIINSNDINEATVQEQTTQPVEQAPVEQPVVQDQTVIENISGKSLEEIDTVQNIVENSTVDVTNSNQVNEVKVEETKTYKNPSKLSTILVIILFIALFVFVFEMPKINEWMETRKQNQEIDQIEQEAKRIEDENKKAEEAKKQQEQQAKEEEEKKEASIKKLRCSINKAATETTTYSTKIVETFDYNEQNQVVASSQTITYTFTTQDTNYTNLKTECNNNSTKYMGKKGFTMSCGSDELTVTIGREFDLLTYETIKDGTTTITPNATKNEDISAVKTKLTTAGYTCE